MKSRAFGEISRLCIATPPRATGLALSLLHIVQPATTSRVTPRLPRIPVTVTYKGRSMNSAKSSMPCVILHNVVSRASPLVRKSARPRATALRARPRVILMHIIHRVANAAAHTWLQQKNLAAKKRKNLNAKRIQIKINASFRILTVANGFRYY